jgi:hypothetical protein
MSAGKVIGIGFKTLLVTIVVGISFVIGAMVSGIGRGVPAPTGAAVTSPAMTLLLYFIASLVQAMVATYIVLQADWSGWKVAGGLFLLSLNPTVQSAIEAAAYLQGHLPPHFVPHLLIMGLVSSALFAPLAVWILGGFQQGPRQESGERPRWSAARWTGTLAVTTLVGLVLYYLCGYYIAWQSAALRQFYSGSTAIRSFWGQVAWTWSASPWMFPCQAVRALLFVGLTLPAIRMLRGGTRRVVLGTALMYVAFDGSPALILPNPLMPPAVAHVHAIEMVVWGLLFGAFVGWAMSRDRTAARAKPQVARAA